MSSPKKPSEPVAKSSVDDRAALRTELEKQKAANAELQARLSAGAHPASADDAAYADRPKHGNAYTVQVIAGPAKGDEVVTVENCCDESEAIRRVCVRRGIPSNEHRFQVQKIEQASA